MSKIPDDFWAAGFELLVAGQERQASRDPKYNEACGKTLIQVVMNPGCECRMWFDNYGEMGLAYRVFYRMFKHTHPKGVSLTSDTHDDETMVMLLELSNGSAIVLGLKEHEHLYKENMNAQAASDAG